MKPDFALDSVLQGFIIHDIFNKDFYLSTIDVLKSYAYLPNLILNFAESSEEQYLEKLHWLKDFGLKKSTGMITYLPDGSLHFHKSRYIFFSDHPALPEDLHFPPPKDGLWRVHVTYQNDLREKKSLFYFHYWDDRTPKVIGYDTMTSALEQFLLAFGDQEFEFSLNGTLTPGFRFSLDFHKLKEISRNHYHLIEYPLQKKEKSKEITL